MRKINLWCISLCALAVAAQAAKEPKADQAWVVIKPLQCLDNAWEKDWLAHHKKKASKYPRRDEVKIMKDYFANQGVHVLDIRAKPYQGGPLCQTCGCQRGDTLYLLVNGADSLKMKNLGFEEILPADDASGKSKSR